MSAKAEPTLEELAAEVERLEQALWEAQRQLDEVRQAPFQVGDVALTRRLPKDDSAPPDWEQVIVRRVVPRWWGPGYYVSYRRRTGEWSKAEVWASHPLRQVEPIEEEA